MASASFPKLQPRGSGSPGAFQPWKDPEEAALAGEDAGLEEGPSTPYTLRNVEVRAWLTDQGIKLIPASIGCWPQWQLRRLPTFVPYGEILAARPGIDSLSPCCWSQMHKLEVFTFQRGATRPCEWRPCKLVLTTPDEEVVQDWAAEIGKALARLPERPHRLLVLINPYGGARQAPSVWSGTVRPLFELAGISCRVVETRHSGHAGEFVLGLPPLELASVDGIVAVGGDGLFSEALNALLALRHAEANPSARVHTLRLGHVPAGSTDAVGYSWHGTRCRATAALHIALGDRMPLDVMRVEDEGARLGARFAACVARWAKLGGRWCSYGYMGDLLRSSERLRFLGPSRYQLAGAATLLRGRWYEADIAFRPVLPVRPSPEARECRAGCQHCSTSRRSLLQQGPEGAAGDPPGGGGEPRSFAEPADEAAAQGWEHRQGRFMSVMVVVTPCRSAMSTVGLVASSHLADGALHLVLVHKCAWPLYLKFLTTIPRTGALPSRTPFVEVIECSAVRVQPKGQRSAWNVDGEVLQPECFSARACDGLVDVFARGVE